MVRKRRDKREQVRSKRRYARPIWKRSATELTPRKRRVRAKSLEALALVRREKLTLRQASGRVGLEPNVVRRNTNAFRRVRGRWKAKTFDHMPRNLIIYEKGRKVIVEVTDSRIASLIGEYHNRMKHFLETGRSRFLKELRRKRFKDSKGRTHTLETDAKTVFAIKQREPTPEFFEIYRW